ncbi:MAG: InlB B-repeat-containing protein [Clostridia bacterium]|nr:InlB B-repeat-containing protein [Clostridia bacterium]
MDSVFTEILDMSMTASFMIAAILLIRPLVGKVSKNINCILWALAGLRLIFPFSLRTKLSAVPDIQSITPEIMTDTVPQAQPTLPSEPMVQPKTVDVLSILSTVWVIGIALLTVYYLVSFILIKKKTSVSLHEGDNVYICDGIKSAFILGRLTPRIYLPSDTAREQREHIIAHERAHIRRLDYLWKPVGLGIAILHWFNPLAWAGYIFLCRDIELACDETVTRNMSAERKRSYALALLESTVSGYRYNPSPLAFGEVGVKNRIKSILNYRKPAFWVSFGIIAICIAVAVMFMTDPIISAKLPDPIPEVVVKDTEKTKETEAPETEETETEPAETEPQETEPIETEPIETEPKESETKEKETEAVETKPVETKPVETKPVETKPVETKPVETEPKETKPAETTTSKPQKDPEPEVVTHTVTFVANGGYCEKTAETVTHGQSSVTLPMPTRSGYIFDGWWDAPEGGTRVRNNTVCTTADTVLYAHWRENNTVNVRLMYDGKIETLTLTKGSSFGTLFAPEKEGYAFDGWYLNGSEKVYPDTLVPDYDVHLEARWIED